MILFSDLLTAVDREVIERNHKQNIFDILMAFQYLRNKKNEGLYIKNHGHGAGATVAKSKHSTLMKKWEIGQIKVNLIE